LASIPLHIPEFVRRSAESQGEHGIAWLAALGELVADLAHEWGLELGRSVAGGTESFVIEATTEDGEKTVLKVVTPGLDNGHRELDVLLAANGRGYARVIRHDRARHAMLLERLGPQLHELGLSTDKQIDIICSTLLEAWTHPPKPNSFMSGAEKADSLSEVIRSLWTPLERSCSRRTVDKALAYAEIRRSAFNPDQAVVAHGDAHAWNTLVVPGSGNTSFKFVDPDGVFVERAYDLAIPMREWGAELLAGDPVGLGRRRCLQLARLTDVDPQPIWQWALMERVANGLLLFEIGLDALAVESLDVADAWALDDLF
jgi:streptomycin 6-kinase